MKRYAKLLQMDERGQLVIPKDVRQEMGLDAGVGFALYALDNEAILLKPIPMKDLEDHPELMRELETNLSKLKLSKKALEKAQQRYKKVDHRFSEL